MIPVSSPSRIITSPHGRPLSGDQPAARRHQLLFELLTKVRLNVEIRITCDVWRIECFISIPP